MRSTEGQMEEFFRESKIWADIKDELESWINDNHLMLEDPTGVMKLEDFKSHAAICTALRRVIAIDIYIMQSFKKENQDAQGLS